jgi:hypothetical protein
MILRKELVEEVPQENKGVGIHAYVVLPTYLFSPVGFYRARG